MNKTKIKYYTGLFLFGAIVSFVIFTLYHYESRVFVIYLFTIHNMANSYAIVSDIIVESLLSACNSRLHPKLSLRSPGHA